MAQRTLEIVIPVYKPGDELRSLLKRLERQTCPPLKVHLMHTLSGEPLPELSDIGLDVEVHPLERDEFDHGGTRDLGMSFCTADVVMFMTQDAMPANERLTQILLDSFEDERCAAAYARQLPRPEHGVIEGFTRRFNYPGEDRVQSTETLEELGIKTYFCSDACAAYRRDLYYEAGGFEKPCIFNEDMLLCYRLISAGYTVCYRADAHVIHSHRYTPLQQFHRNFDLGVSQAQHPEIFSSVSSTAEGTKLVGHTASFLLRRGRILSVFYLVVLSGMKWLGYKSGLMYKHLPLRLIRLFSMNQSYWKH